MNQYAQYLEKSANQPYGSEQPTATNAASNLGNKSTFKQNNFLDYLGQQAHQFQQANPNDATNSAAFMGQVGGDLMQKGFNNFMGNMFGGQGGDSPFSGLKSLIGLGDKLKPYAGLVDKLPSPESIQTTINNFGKLNNAFDRYGKYLQDDGSLNFTGMAKDTAQKGLQSVGQWIAKLPGGSLSDKPLF
jgi:hypothetical protein